MRVTWQVMLGVLHLVTLGLLVLVIVRGGGWLLPLLFAIVYVALQVVVAGKIEVFPHKKWIAPAILLLALVALWIGLLTATEYAAYLAFPLFFVVLEIVGGWLAVLGVVAIVAITIGAEVCAGETTVGSVMGPTIGGAVALTLGLGFRYLVAEAHHREEIMRELVETRKEAVAASRSAGEMAERARLAGEIHDTVAQGLSSIQLLLGAALDRLDAVENNDAALEAHRGLAENLADDPALQLPHVKEKNYQTVRHNIELAQQTAAESLAETRSIIAALQPQPLEGADLPVALARLVASTPMGTKCAFHVDGEPRKLPANVEAAVLRIVQSAVANVVRHSQAERAQVTLTYQAEGVRVDIVDNGVGFDASDASAPAPAGSVGMSVMRERVAELGGTLTVETAPGAGTGIAVEIPCATGDPESAGGTGDSDDSDGTGDTGDTGGTAADSAQVGQT